MRFFLVKIAAVCYIVLKFKFVKLLNPLVLIVLNSIQVFIAATLVGSLFVTYYI